MLIVVEQVLSPAALADIRRRLDAAAWVDGAATAGAQSRQAKRNQQLAQDDAEAIALGRAVVAAVSTHPTFLAAALPRKIYPPLFNRYRPGDGFDAHVDNSIRLAPDGREQIRTDLSATLFLSDPADYDGGELVMEGAFGLQEAKLVAGDLVLYPASSLHRVNPVTRGERLAAVFWSQSFVRDDGERTLLFELDQAAQACATATGVEHQLTLQLTNIYHNLVRRWAET